VKKFNLPLLVSLKANEILFFPLYLQ